VAFDAVVGAVMCGQIDAQRLESTRRFICHQSVANALEEFHSDADDDHLKFNDSNSSSVHG
jgi:hypothetical protein